MLPKQKRISRPLFKEILLSKRYSNSPHFSLRVAQAASARAAVSVSKKISKKSVIRNRVRRRAYAAIQTIIGEMNPGLYLFVAKPGVEKIKGEELNKEILTLIRSIKA